MTFALYNLYQADLFTQWQSLVHVTQWLEHLTDHQKVTCCTHVIHMLYHLSPYGWFDSRQKLRTIIRV